MLWGQVLPRQVRMQVLSGGTVWAGYQAVEKPWALTSLVWGLASLLMFYALLCYASQCYAALGALGG